MVNLDGNPGRRRAHLTPPMFHNGLHKKQGEDTFHPSWYTIFIESTQYF